MGKDLPQIVPSGAGHRILGISEHALQPIPTQLAVELLMADLGLDARSAPHLLLDGLADALPAPGDDHPAE